MRVSFANWFSAPSRGTLKGDFGSQNRAKGCQKESKITTKGTKMIQNHIPTHNQSTQGRFTSLINPRKSNKSSVFWMGQRNSRRDNNSIIWIAYMREKRLTRSWYCQIAKYIKRLSKLCFILALCSSVLYCLTLGGGRHFETGAPGTDLHHILHAQSYIHFRRFPHARWPSRLIKRPQN